MNTSHGNPQFDPTQHSRSDAAIAFHTGLAPFWAAVQGAPAHFYRSPEQAAKQGFCHFVRQLDGGLGWLDLTRHDLLEQLLPDLECQAYRMQRALHERVAKACGVTRHRQMQLCDGTAGLGRDGLILAACGARVTLVERNPVMVMLLARLLQQLQVDAELVCADSRTWLRDRQYDVVYLDPMFPQRAKSAAVGKEIALLQLLESPAQDHELGEMLQGALDASRYRTVVKRPVKAGALDDRRPSGCISGKTVRFDFYTKRSLDSFSPASDA